jgi:hypothetical protein
MQHRRLVRIDALPTIDMIEQDRGRDVRIQQHRVDIVGLQKIEQQLDVLEERRTVVFDRNSSPQSSARPSMKTSMPRQIRYPPNASWLITRFKLRDLRMSTAAAAKGRRRQLICANR